MRKTWILSIALILSFQLIGAQGITTHAYRKVAPENMQEYLKRETTYWKKFAEQEVKKGNLTFWGIFQKVGGIDQENEPNILIVNTFNDIDKQLNWGAVADLFPNVEIKDISTAGISTNMATIFLRNLGNHVQGSDVVPSEDFKYVKVIYHNAKNANVSLKFEKEKWKPMIQKAMNEGKTTMKGWGNARIVHPRSSSFPYNVYSYDLFSSLKDVLSPVFKDPFPEGFFEDISGNENGPRSHAIYRIVSVVSD